MRRKVGLQVGVAGKGDRRARRAGLARRSGFAPAGWVRRADGVRWPSCLHAFAGGGVGYLDIESSDPDPLGWQAKINIRILRYPAGAETQFLADGRLDAIAQLRATFPTN